MTPAAFHAVARQLCALAVAAALHLAAPSADARQHTEALSAATASVVAVLPRWPPGIAQPDEVEGSGVVVLDGRTVVTAYHVVDKALSLTVRTADGDVLAARLKASDPATDLAVIEIDRALPPLAFAGDARFGEPVCALGHPFGFGLSMTCGIVSAVHKSGAGFNPVEDFVQTDAAVNPGMSGGALLRPDGALIGIITAIFTARADGNLGLNFAVAAPLAARVVDDLVRDGRVARVETGLRLGAAVRRGETGRLGARVLAIAAGSPAAAAGLVPGDVILRAGGRRIVKPADFVGLMGRMVPGAALDLTLARGDQERSVTLRLPAAP